jgi:hypothetical protein
MEEVRNLSSENSFTGESLMRDQLCSSLPGVLIFQIARNSLSNCKTIFKRGRIASFKDQNYLKDSKVCERQHIPPKGARDIINGGKDHIREICVKKKKKKLCL